MPSYTEVDSEKWSDMTLADLYEQLSVLRSRAFTASQLNNQSMLDQITRGIVRLEDIILEKSDNDTTISM